MKTAETGKNGSQKSRRRTMVVLSAIIVILAATNIWTAFFYNKTSDGSFIKVNGDYPFLDPARGIHDPKDLIINIQPLRNELNEIGKNENISIYFEYLPTGANIAVNKDANFYPASLLKLPVVMAAVKKIEKDEWKWENELVLMGSDKDSRFGELYKRPIGTTFTIRELVNQMLIESDDTAYNIVLRNLEPDELGDVHKHLGLEDFLKKGEKISAKQYAVILRSLYAAAYLNEENSEELLKTMVNSKYHDYLGSAIPSDVQFAHKIGVSGQQQVFLDAGIVYVPRRPYLLIAMMEIKDEAEAKRIMQVISEKSYNYVVNYGRI